MSVTEHLEVTRRRIPGFFRRGVRWSRQTGVRQPMQLHSDLPKGPQALRMGEPGELTEGRCLGLPQADTASCCESTESGRIFPAEARALCRQSRGRQERPGRDLPAHSVCIPPPDSDFANPGCWRPGSTLGQQCNPSWFPHLYTCYCDNCEALGPKQRKTRQHSLAGIIPNGVSSPDICVCPALWLLTASGLAGQPWGGWCDLGLPFLLLHLHQAFGCWHGAL